MNDRLFTKEEIETIQVVVGRYLRPINGALVIKTPPTHLSAFVNEQEFDEYIYRCEFHTDKGNIETSVSFPDIVADISQIAWHIACDVWSRIDGNINSEIAENLWPRANNLHPDYQRFMHG